jgi:hypothetical protein
MKKYSIGFLILLICMGTDCSLEQEQELIISSKNKKKYVSEQQYVELEGQMVIMTNEYSGMIAGLQGSLAHAQQIIAALQKKMLSDVNDYIDGEKECFVKQADKIQRTDCYEKLTKLKNSVESYAQKMQKMQQQIDLMCTNITKQFQDVLNVVY